MLQEYVKSMHKTFRIVAFLDYRLPFLIKSKNVIRGYVTSIRNMSSPCKNVWNCRILGLRITVSDKIKKCKLAQVELRFYGSNPRIRNFKSVMKFGTRKVSTLEVFTVNIYEKCRHAKSGTKSGTKLVVRFFLCPISAFCTRCPLGKEKKRTFTKSGGFVFYRFCAAFVSKYFVYYQC
jgi:hypothetical protein